MSVIGIDVSKYQATTPRLSDVDFLIARATIGTQRDERYDQHIAKAKEAGIMTGAYHFNWDAVSVPSQVAAFLDAAGDVDLYALDVEGANAFSRSQSEAFIQRVQDQGKHIGLYHSLSGFFDAGQDWDWVAYWADQSPNRHWDIWQYGPINGVDGNRFNGSLEQLEALAGVGGSMAQKPITDVTPKTIDIAAGSKRYMLDGRPDGYVFDKAYTRFSPYAVDTLRSYYATVDGKLVLRLVVPSNVQDIPGAPPDDTPFSQADIDEAFNAGVDAAASVAVTVKR